MVEIKVRKGNINDIKLSKSNTIDLRDRGIKKNIELRKIAKRQQVFQKIWKSLQLIGISLILIGFIGGTVHFKIDQVQAKDIELNSAIENEDYTEQDIEQVVNDIDKEYNQTREEQIRIKEQEIKLYDEETKRLELDRKKEIQKKEIEKVSVRDNLIQPKKELFPTPGKTPKIESKKELLPEEVKTSKFDIDKLARAVALQETADCTKGYGKTHNNCFGIKHGNTVPCPGVPKMTMCKFKTKEESYEAFKIIWTKWYGELPDARDSNIWTGNDRPEIWRNAVLHFYNNDKI